MCKTVIKLTFNMPVLQHLISVVASAGCMICLVRGNTLMQVMCFAIVLKCA